VNFQEAFFEEKFESPQAQYAEPERRNVACRGQGFALNCFNVGCVLPACRWATEPAVPNLDCFGMTSIPLGVIVVLQCLYLML
jgi:hypothetical protein